MEKILEIQGLGKQYRGFRLSEVSFGLEPGFVMGLIGPNGAGKTTTIKLILNLVNRDSGTIRAFGHDNLASETEIKSRIGVVFDEPNFFLDASLSDHRRALAPFYPNWDDRRFDALVSRFELPMRKKYKALSQGMKTRFGLALALSHHPELLILDEPTAGLDPVFRRELLFLMQELVQDGRTSILFSTHITSDLERIADSITFLNDGCLVFSTTIDEIRDRWAVVKGGPELLRSLDRGLFEGIRKSSFGVQALTRDVTRIRERLPRDVVVNPASLEEIMVLSGKESEPCIC